MSISKYDLRSKDIQEVMKSPPNSLITWGNSIIVAIVLLSILFTEGIKLPVKVVLPCRIEAVTSTISDYKCVLLLLSGLPIPKNIKLNEKVRLDLDILTTSNFGSIEGTISNINSDMNTIECVVKSVKYDGIGFLSGNNMFLVKGVAGVMKINVGIISMRRLFLNKIIRSFGN